MLRLRLTAAVFAALTFLAGCATPPPAPPPPPAHTAQDDAAARYGAAMIQTITADQQVQQILAANNVTQSLAIGLIVDPNGYVEKGFAPKAGQNDVAVQAVLGHLINVNFGTFTPDMPGHRLVFVLPVRVAQGPAPAENAFAYHMARIVLYQPNNVLIARACDPRLMASYIQQLNAAMEALFTALPPGTGANASLVIGLKPGGAVRAWVVDKDGKLPADLQARIITTAEAVPPMPVQDGPVAFALEFSAWGGSATPITELPMPDAWMNTTGKVEVPDGVFAQIWP